MEGHHHPSLAVGPVTFDLTILAMSALTVVVVFGLMFWASRQMQSKPRGKQNVLEYAYDFVYGIAKENLGEHYAPKYTLFLMAIFGFLLISNNLGLVTKLQDHHGANLWTSPTADLVVDLGLAFLVTIFCHYQGIKERGWLGYFKSFATPAALTPMNILEEVTNFLSLALRLFGNIYAGEVLIDLLLQLSQVNTLGFVAAYPLVVVWIAFSIFISCLQAYVFTLLTSMYIGKKVNGH